MSWDEVRKDQIKWDDMKCEVWRVESEAWSVKWTVKHFRKKHARTGLAGARRMQVL